ncbi:MAG: potassium channel family protein [Pseudomonadota bacterium]
MLVGISLVDRLYQHARAQLNRKILVLAVTSMVLLLLMLHFVEAFIWARVYLYLGEFSNMEDALYFSIVTATSLGYGDITLSTDWRLMSSVQAIGSFILYSVSAAGLFQMMLNIFPSPLSQVDSPLR